MLWWLLAFLIVWVAAGVAVLLLGSRPAGSDYRRTAVRRLGIVGERLEVSITVSPPVKPEAPIPHDLLLVVDHSSSMGASPGSPFREAVRIAENIVRSLPPHIFVGLIAFNHEASLVCPFTGDHHQALAALEAISPGGDAALHTALNRCSEALDTGRVGVKKTIVVLSNGQSDFARTQIAAQRLHRHMAEPLIHAVAFGSAPVHEVMMAVAGSSQRCYSEDDSRFLQKFYANLAATVTGAHTLAGVVEEGVRAPNPFQLLRTEGLFPSAVQPTDHTWITWSFPLADPQPVTVSYRVAPLCPGWHAVAMSESGGRWTGVDGEVRKFPGPKGPKILVLPKKLGWAWPLLNPLFWLLFGRFWCRNVGRPEASLKPEGDAAPLPRPSFPEPMPLPQKRPYAARLRPALLIGLGKTGEWTLFHLKERLHDRGIDPAQVKLLNLSVSHQLNRQPTATKLRTLSLEERLNVVVDLRPYGEQVRERTPPARNWIPVREWLCPPQPLTTQRRPSDRRQARLALLLDPEPVVSLIAPLARHCLKKEGMAVLVGSATDPECSGLLAETAHILACRGLSVTAVLTPPLTGDLTSRGTVALARELERLVLMRGEPVFSDREEPPVSARQLFDRIVVLERPEADVESAGRLAAEFLWNLLACEAMLARLPISRDHHGKVICTGAVVDGYAVPWLGRWIWVRESTLAWGILEQWLQLAPREGGFSLSAMAAATAPGDRQAFWTGTPQGRSLTPFLAQAGLLLKPDNELETLLALKRELPVDEPYHLQAAYCLKERRQVARYLEGWSHAILEREQDRGSCGLLPLIQAVLAIQDDGQLILERLTMMSGNDAFLKLIKFASSLLIDFLHQLDQMHGEVGGWLARLIGSQPDLGVTPPPAGVLPLSAELEAALSTAEEALRFPDPKARTDLEEKYAAWLQDYGEPFFRQWRFRIQRHSLAEHLSLYLTHREQTFPCNEPILHHMRAALDQYRAVVLNWKVEDWFLPHSLPDPGDRFLLGRYAPRTFPQVTQILEAEDPGSVAAIKIRELPLSRALGMPDLIPPGELPYAWPEEANAARIAAKITNRLHRQPHPFTPAMVHLMRDTFKLHAFLGELATGGVKSAGGLVMLTRNGRDYPIGPSRPGLASLNLFQDLVRQAVSLEVSLEDEWLPVPTVDWFITPEAAVREVEAHPIVAAATTDPDWPRWQDLIRGLALEHGGA